MPKAPRYIDLRKVEMSLNHPSSPISKISSPLPPAKLKNQPRSAAQSQSENRPGLESQYRRQSSATAADHAPTCVQNQLVPCVYIALRCSHCGELRQALHLTPSSDSVACPECGIACSFILLGSGFTKAQLPFHELLSSEQTRWIVRDVESIDCS
jgi:DNA-directed RNA polymerase subunit RPC12/RpoP